MKFMANHEKSKKIYKETIEEFDRIAAGTAPQDIEGHLQKSYHMFLQDYPARPLPSSDYGAKCINNLKKYASLVSARRNVVIEGGSREITTEDEALGSLKLAHALASDLILPQFKKTNDLTNRIFRDLFYLSLSYVDSIADGVADEYISKERALDSKVKAVAVAKEGLRVREHYLKQGINQIGTQNLENMGMQLANVDETLMRPFKIVATSPKKVHRKEELTEKIKQELIRSDPLYLPSVIFPIAHGGNE